VLRGVITLKSITLSVTITLSSVTMTLINLKNNEFIEIRRKVPPTSHDEMNVKIAIIRDNIPKTQKQTSKVNISVSETQMGEALFAAIRTPKGRWSAQKKTPKLSPTTSRWPAFSSSGSVSAE